MSWIVLTIVLILVSIAAFVGSRWLKQPSGGRDIVPDDVPVHKFVQFGVPLGAAALWIVMTILSSVNQVQAGYVGVVYEFGSIVDQTDEGLQIVAPWREVKNANVQVQTLAFVDEGDRAPEGARRVGPGLDSFSEESQNVYIDAVLNIEVSPDNVQDLYRNVGPNYVNKLIPGRIAQIFKDETVNYKAVDIAPAREAIRANVEEQLKRELAPYSITVTALLVENINFDQPFTDAITRKQVAQQDALAEQEKIKSEAAKADQQIEAARGRAESVKVEALAQSEANRALTESLTPILVQWQAVQKLSDNVTIALIPSGEGVIIDPTTLLAGVPTATGVGGE